MNPPIKGLLESDRLKLLSLYRQTIEELEDFIQNSKDLERIKSCEICLVEMRKAIKELESL